MIAEHRAGLVAAAQPEVLRRLTGAVWLAVDDGMCEEAMEPAPAMRSTDGTTTMGARQNVALPAPGSNTVT